jgi:hypothetical protein
MEIIAIPPCMPLVPPGLYALTSLQKNIQKFIWALLLLPNVQWYAGTNENTVIVSTFTFIAVQHLLTGLSMQQAMRNSNISDLPPLESAECEVLVKDVAREYSVQRSTLKKKVSSEFLLYIHELTLLSRSPTPLARRLTSQLSPPTSSHTASTSMPPWASTFVLP